MVYYNTDDSTCSPNSFLDDTMAYSTNNGSIEEMEHLTEIEAELLLLYEKIENNFIGTEKTPP